MLTQELLKSVFNYDPETGDFFRKGHVFTCGTINKRKYSSYAVLSIKINGVFRKVYSHRAAWIFIFGEIPDGFVIDHIDGNGLNNTINNLRVVTKSINQRNRHHKFSTRSIAGITAHRGGFSVYFVTGYVKWVKDYFEACCIRKSLESKTAGFNDIRRLT